MTSSANTLNLDRCGNVSFGKVLTLSKTTTLRFFQTEKTLQASISNLMKVVESPRQG